MSGAASEWRPIALTAKIYREGDQYVAHCVELDIASCGDTEEEAFENLVDASDVYVTTLEETGQIERVFAERGINLSKIESRPTRHKPWEYNLYLDFDGHREDSMAKEALNSLEPYSLFLKILGSYPKAK